MNTVRLARWLSDRGWSITLLAVRGYPLHREGTRRGLRCSDIRRNWRHGDIRCAWRLEALLEARGISMLFVFDTRDIGVAGLAKALARDRFTLIYQQHMQLGRPQRDLFRRRRLARIDAWITPLRCLADDIRRRTRYDPQRIHVIPLGIELDTFLRSPHTREAARQTLAVPQGVRLAGIVGRIDEQKGQHVVVEAVNRLARAGKPVHLLIVGDSTKGESTAYGRRLSGLIAANGLNALVHRRPFADDVTLVYRAIDVLVLASTAETYGMVTIEAMAMGLPVIGTNSGGTPEILGQGELGMLYQPGNAGELAERLDALLSDETKMRELGEKAKSAAVERYSHIRECEQIGAVIEACG
jgi:D-inositol-3-phosphate glycosyltransferase